MKIKIQHLMALSLLLGGVSALGASVTAFTYQGELQDSGALAQGTYNLTFSLFKTNADGAAVAGPVTNTSVSVSAGRLITTIDFGSSAFAGATNWLQIGVATNGSFLFTALDPRQLVTPTPYAIYAYQASNLNGTLPATQLSGTVPLARLSGITSNQFDTLSWQRATNLNGGRAAVATNVVNGVGLTNAFVTNSIFAGDGAGLTNLAVTSLSGALGGKPGLDGVVFGTNVYLGANPLYLRGNLGTDHSGGLGYNGNGVATFPNAAVQPDGPVLWGQGGGALGVLAGGARPILSWTNSGVSINGSLTASNTPGVNWSQAGGNTAIPTGGLQVDTCTNSRVAAGYFIIFATATLNANGNTVTLHLLDTTSGSVDLFDVYGSGAGPTTVALSYVVPIAAAGAPQSFTLSATASGLGSSLYGHNLTVLYVPRLNN